MIISEATPLDIPLLAKFQCQMAEETENLNLDQSSVEAGIQAMFDDPARGKYFTARINNTLAGCLMITLEWSEWRNAYVIWIQSVYVDNAFRKQGVYAALYNHIKTMVRENDMYQGIRLYVDQSNTAAQKVYQALGMTDQHYFMYEWMNE